MEIRDAESIHSIGYSLKEIKTTLNRDIKINVAGIKIEGSEGEVINAPLWIGEILQDRNYVALELPDMISELKQALSKEKMIGEYTLATLYPHFYIQLRAEMSTLDRYEYDLTESMMIALFRLRRGKLIKMADTMKLNADLYNKLAIEESTFYELIRNNILEFELAMEGKRDERKTS